MAKEIERKFLVEDETFVELSTIRFKIKQGYISRRPEGTVRIRIRDDRAFLTVKGRNSGAVRDEWEYEIPVSDAEEMLGRCIEGTILEKTRYVVPFGGFDWEIDVFAGAKAGLKLAEIELPSADTEFAVPPFVGEEVTGNPAYYNSNL